MQNHIFVTKTITLLNKQMRTYEIIRRAISLRGRDIQEVATVIGTSREHLSRYVNGRSPNFSQELLDQLFRELGLKVVLVMEDIDVLLAEDSKDG